MTLRWRDAGNVLRTAGAIYIRDESAVLRTVDQIRIRDGDGVLREVYKQGIRLSVTPGSAYGTGISGPITTNSVTVGVAGGTPPYTHSWSAGGSVVPNSPTSATTSFTKSGASVETTATDLVTDTNGLTNSVTIPVSIERGSGGA